jgi:protein-tyrosine phosphatase
MKKCTGQSNPLRIDELRSPHFPGVVGMTHCPGRKLQGLSGDCDWDRDLPADLAAIESWGAEVLISLIEEHEYRFVGVERLPELVPEHIRHLRLPIADASVPGSVWEQSWRREGPSVRGVLARGGRVCIHCMGGFGRTGLLAARILVEFGEEPERAIRAVRAARPGAIETSEQEAYVRAVAGGFRPRSVIGPP